MNPDKIIIGVYTGDSFETSKNRISTEAKETWFKDDKFLNNVISLLKTELERKTK